MTDELKPWGQRPPLLMYPSGETESCVASDQEEDT